MISLVRKLIRPHSASVRAEPVEALLFLQPTLVEPGKPRTRSVDLHNHGRLRIASLRSDQQRTTAEPLAHARRGRMADTDNYACYDEKERKILSHISPYEKQPTASVLFRFGEHPTPHHRISLANSESTHFASPGSRMPGTNHKYITMLHAGREVPRCQPPARPQAPLADEQFAPRRKFLRAEHHARGSR